MNLEQFNYLNNNLHIEDVDLVDLSSNIETPFYVDSSKTIKFVLSYLAEAVVEGQESARKQGLVQKLEGEGGPKVFSLNSSTQKVPAKAVNKPQQEEDDLNRAVVESEKEIKKISEPAAKAAPKKPAAKAAPKKTAVKKK